MYKEGYYSSGQFAKRANVTIRTIRYYDNQNILKPSYITESGARFYTDADFTRLQQVLLFKYLGFSLEDIKALTIGDSDKNILKNSLLLQKRLIDDKIAKMQLVSKAIGNTVDSIDEKEEMDWENMLQLIHLTSMESTMKAQYVNAENISARINLHTKFSVNKQGWFPWVYSKCAIKAGMRILELGCGDASFWTLNVGHLAKEGRGKTITIDMTDISEGMLNDAKRNIGEATKSWKDRDINVNFRYRVGSAEKINAKDGYYDLVIANHVLFYCEDIDEAIREIKRVLKPGGMLVCSTYGSMHMQEMGRLVAGFDKRIQLEDEKLYERFGLENGERYLKKCFDDVTKLQYEDYLLVDEPEALVQYILSCHGNQKEYLLDRYGEFKSYVNKKLVKPLKITKEAGIYKAIKR